MQYIVRPYIIMAIQAVCFMATAHKLASPTLTTYDSTGVSYTKQSAYYDHRIIAVARNHISSLRQTMPETITYRYNEVQSCKRSDIVYLLECIRSYIRTGMYEHIDAIAYRLKDENFHYPSGTGMLILKLHSYPFIIKFFRESAQSIHQSHGFEPYFFMFMNGNINRHIAGLTRITNNYTLAQFLRTHRNTYPNITTPRAWAWTPEDADWMRLSLTYRGTTQEADIPCEYALINDCIQYVSDQNAPRDLVLSLFQDTNSLFDPHDGNCIYETPLNQYVILDTESFMDMVGFSEPIYTQSYIQWYLHMIRHCFTRILFPHLTRPNPEQAYAQYARAYGPIHDQFDDEPQSSHTHA